MMLIARALVKNPKVLIIDEPESNYWDWRLCSRLDEAD